MTINNGACQGPNSATVTWPDGHVDTLTNYGPCTGTDQTAPHQLPTTCCDEGNTHTLTVHYNEPGANPPPQDSVWTITFVEGDLLTPQITQINPQEGQAFTQVIANFTNTSPDQPATPGSDFTATIDWGDGSPLETNVTVNGGAGGPYTVMGTHTYMDEGPEPNGNGGGGNYLVHVTIADPGNAPPVGDAAFPVTVQEMDNITWTGNLMTISPTEGQPVDDVLATFTDTYAQNVPSDFAVQITWTDTATGTATQSQGAVSGSGGTFQITGGGFVPPDEGTYDLQLTLSDNAPGGLLGGTPATAIVAEGDSLSVLNFPFTTVAEGTAIDNTLAIFSDTDSENTGADFGAIISWGDKTSSGGSVDGDNGQIMVDGHHVYADEGLYLVKVTLIDDKPGNAKATAQGFITVTEADKLAAGPTVAISAAAGSQFQGRVAAVLDTGYQTVDNSGQPNPAEDFRATINWGDNTSTSAGTVSIDAPAQTQTQTQYDISGSHTYRYAGSYTVKVTLSDDKPGPAPITLASATVTNKATVSGTGSACKQGDVNCDGTVNSTDASCELYYIANLSFSAACTHSPQGNPDVNGDGIVNHVDLLCINRIIANAPSTPACPIFGAGSAPVRATSEPSAEPPVQLTLTPGPSLHPDLASPTRGSGAGGESPTSVFTLRANAAGAGLGAWTVDLAYDPQSTQVSSCTATAGVCIVGDAAGVIRIVGASYPGLSGDQSLATISVKTAGHSTGAAVQIGSASLVDPDGATLGISGAATAGGKGN